LLCIKLRPVLYLTSTLLFTEQSNEFAVQNKNSVQTGM